MKKRNRLNCWLVAMRLWFGSRGRSIFGVRRSEGLGGLVPHALVIRERGALLTVIDYVPRKRKRSFIGRGDFVLLFNGKYRVRRYRLVGKGYGDCARSAIRQLRRGNVKLSDENVCIPPGRHAVHSRILRTNLPHEAGKDLPEQLGSACLHEAASLPVYRKHEAL